jgi:hypothetical protein
MKVFKKLYQFWQTRVASDEFTTRRGEEVMSMHNRRVRSKDVCKRVSNTYNYWAYRYILVIVLIFCNPYPCCLAEDETSEISLLSLEEIEQGLLNQNSDANPPKIEREDLPKLEDKKKESISSEINLPQESGAFSYKKTAKIIILNKITAKSELIEFKLGKVKLFGHLSVEVHKCAKNTDPLKPSNLMLITVFDSKLDDDKLLVFHGWMDSSNLSISTLEHPVYEVIPMECVD